jgi:hypothetical protein
MSILGDLGTKIGTLLKGHDTRIDALENAPISSSLDSGGTINGEVTIYQTSQKPTSLTLHNHVSDISGTGGTGNYIEFKSTDGNATLTPQVKIGMEVNSNNGTDSGIGSEGDGNFVVYTANATDDVGNGTINEHLRVTNTGSTNVKSLNVVSDDGIYIKTTTDASGAKIRFSDVAASGSQKGSIEYYHGDTHIRNNIIEGGYGDAFLIKGTENTAVKIEGDLFVHDNKVITEASTPKAIVWMGNTEGGWQGTGTYPANTNTYLQLTATNRNSGGFSLNTSNYGITVPKTGIYRVSGKAYSYAMQYHHTQVHINGSYTGGRNWGDHTYTGNYAGGYFEMWWDSTLYCQAGDLIQFAFQAVNSSNASQIIYHGHAGCEIAFLGEA